MTIDTLTNEQRANLDYLNHFYSKNISAHIKLFRTNSEGKNIFLNGFLIKKLTDTLFLMDERKLGKINISLFEVKENGVMEERK
jgi:hypothetical protein